MFNKILDIIKHPVTYARAAVCEIEEGMRARAWARSMAKKAGKTE